MRIAMLLAALLVASQAAPAFAADAMLNFSGTILPPSCTVDSSSANQTITLDTTPVQNFAAVGSTASPAAISLSLINCTAGANVTITVSGTMDTVASVLKNTGTATQVGVQILKATSVGATTGTPITLNSAVNIGVVGSTNSMTVPLVAQYYRLGALTAGTVATTATVNFTYN
jgi:major type 1 subunit fimbrin (pilin)